MATVNPESQENQLATGEVHDILRNERRRYVIEYLKQHEDEASVREIAEYIAEQETDASPPPRDARNSAYISLHQTHLPNLDSHQVVEYNTARKTVTLKDGVRDLEPYLDKEEETEFPWEVFYLYYSMTGALVIVGSLISAPVVSLVEPAAWAIGYAILTICLLGFELAKQFNLIDDPL